jgi:hypothetical protein
MAAVNWSPETVHTFWCDAPGCEESWWGPVTLGVPVDEARADAVAHGWTTDGWTSGRLRADVRDYCPEHSKNDQPKETDR